MWRDATKIPQEDGVIVVNDGRVLADRDPAPGGGAILVARDVERPQGGLRSGLRVIEDR